MTLSDRPEIDKQPTIPDLSASHLKGLSELGYTVVPNVVDSSKLASMSRTYDSLMALGKPPDLAIGSTTTRLADLVSRSAEFEELFLFPPLLDACRHIICQPFKLSTLLGRTLRPDMGAQGFHVDFAADKDGYPMIGFIFMVDDFRRDNGATFFTPGSHAADYVHDSYRNTPVQACGSAGSMIIFNGSVMHGHGANFSGKQRRSVQGAYIRRDAKSAIDFSSRLSSERLAELGSVAQYLLGLR